MNDSDDQYLDDLTEAQAAGFHSVEDRERYLHWLADRNEIEETSTSAHEVMSSFWVDLLELGKVISQKRDWFARGAIEGTPLSVMIGPEKSGKSWILIQLAIATAVGGKWLDVFQIERPGEVVFLDGEYGPPEFFRRALRVCRGMKVDPEIALPRIRYHYSTDVVLERKDPALREVVKSVRRKPPALVIVDPLRNHLAGSENDQSIVTPTYRELDRLRIVGRCPVFLTHHLNKMGGFSGSRAITSRNDLILEGTDTDPPVYGARGRTLRQHIDPIAQPFEVEIDHDRDDSETRASTRVRWKPQGSRKGDPSSLTPMDREILTMLRKQDQPRAVRYIAKVVEKKHDRVSKRLDVLENFGLVALVEAGVQYRGQVYDGYIAAGNTNE